MVDLKKLLFRTAGVSMLISGLTGAYAKPQHMEEDKSMAISRPFGSKLDLKPLQKIHFEERVELVKYLNNKGEEYTEASKKRQRIQGEITEEQETLDRFAKAAGFTTDSTDILKNQSCFLNTVTKQDAKEYANLSALVYDIDQKKSLGKMPSQVTKLDREISTKLDEISMLQEKLASIPRASNVRDFESLKTSLKIFGITLDKQAGVPEVQRAINNRITTVETEVSELQATKSVENTAFLTEARNVFSRNLQGMKYDIEGVFHRNNGEFSGAAAYDKDNHKLVLSFAGSKSWMDWGKNILGMNRKLSKSHGLLSNISFHSGFGSHFDDNADSFFSFMKSWLTQYKETNPNETLTLVGTGHSLGGSLGEIFSAAAKEMAESMGIKINLGIMTFGAPNTVNANTLENYTGRIGEGNVLRFAHSYDPVPALVFWKTAPGGVTVKRDTSLLYDVNGTMELPVRINPHSSDDYYHAAEKVFEDWEKSMAPLKAQLKIVSDLQNEEKEIETTIGKISTEAHQAFVNLAVQDQLSAAAFENEYQSYIQKQQKESEDIIRDFKKLAQQISRVTPETATPSDMKKLLEEYKEFEKRIKEKKAFIESLKSDKAWKTYVEQISDDFAAIQARIAAESMFLSTILTQSVLGNESISTELKEKDLPPTIKTH
ncbi:MAG: lipase family protein [Alphaproteobacteria bacterium]|nr:lipase family protein [Alphaproteobacteria bacterium]